jgi:release factor glutamine methyltransferase
MKLLGEVLKLSTEYLQERKIASPRRQAEELLAAVLGLKRIELYMAFDRPMVDAELEKLRESLRRRGKGEPLGYIFGAVDFYHCRLDINPDVLIPRPETEILLDKIVQELKNLPLEGKVAWDVCCGSGALGIGLKKALPALQVICSDLSPEALAIAKSNSKKNNVEMEVLEGDLLSPFSGKKADFILCNPPYISEAEYGTLDREVRDFEPKRALVGGGEGVELYARLAASLPAHLQPKGKVFFEIGTGQGERVSSLFGASCWKTKFLQKDWAGHDRFFFLEIE